MLKPDVIVSWPRNCDYPLWRHFIHNNRARFNEVIIVFTETHQGNNYVEFAKSQMERDYCLFIKNPIVHAEQDWRDVAIKAALNHSYNAEWIWFTEQDFIIQDDVAFWNKIEVSQDLSSVIGIKQGERLHPACLFIERKVLNKTSRYFGITPNKSDHFGKLQLEIEALQSPITIIPSSMYYHYNGLSHNMSLAGRQEAPNYEPERFYDYMRQCIELEKQGEIRLESSFRGIAEQIISHSPTPPMTTPPASKFQKTIDP